MTHKHNLDEFTPWKIESYELHDTYTHGEPPPDADEMPIAVGQFPRGPDAIMLERALFLAGYTRLVTTPDEDQGLDAPRADNGRTWLDIPQVSLVGTRITLPNGDRASEGRQWPAHAHQIEIYTDWNVNGAMSSKTLSSDLAFGRTDISNPRFAYPFVTPNSKLTLRTLERLILIAHSGADQYEPDAEDLAQHRATARAAADIALNGPDGWLTVVNRLVQERLLCCLQADVKPPDGIRILLHDDLMTPVKTERYSRNDPVRTPIETEPGPARERDNRLRYEHGPFDGHRGILLGTPVTPHSKLWRTLVEMYDERRGRRLWEPESPIHGRVMELDLKLRGMAADEGIENGRYGAVWVAETRRLPNRTRLSRMATSGADRRGLPRGNAREGRHRAARRRVLPHQERRDPAAATRAIRRRRRVVPDRVARAGARHRPREPAQPPPRREPVRLRAVHPRGTRGRGAGVPGEHERRPRAQPGSTPCWGSTTRTTRRRSEVLPYL